MTELGTQLSLNVTLYAVYRILILGFVVLVGFRLRRRFLWPVGATLLCGVASNAVFLAGDLNLAGLIGVPYIALTAWVWVEYMRHDPAKLRALLGSKESAWSKERHDLINDKASLQARLAVHEMPQKDLGSADDK